VLRLDVAFDAATQAWLAHLSGGHPGLLRALSSAAAEGALEAPGPEAALADRLLARPDVKYRCQKLWDALDPVRQAALQFLAGGQLDTVSTDTLAWLRDFGLVEAGEGAYHLFSPVFQRFAIDQPGRLSPLEPVTIVGARTILRNDQEIVVAGKVFKGGREVRVSPHELRLIACLMRERKIYTKDDIIAYVYYEDARRDDVPSNVPIENLVRQVRRRLGDQ
jgi:hypothetical protein